MSQYPWMTKYTPPPEVVQAAETVSRWAAEIDLKDWRILNCASADELTRLRAELAEHRRIASNEHKEADRLRAENEALRTALSMMLDYYGEDGRNKATHDAARAALKEKP